LSVKFNDGHPPDFAYFAAFQEFYVHGAATAEPAGAEATLARYFIAFIVDEDEGKFRQTLDFLM
jgi:hypothetical protein